VAAVTGERDQPASRGGTSGAETLDARAVSRVKRSLIVVIAGLVVQLVAMLSWTPGSFVVAAMVGAPLVVLGIVLFLRAVVRVMVRKGAL
jgi:hypothetical protein